jgi:hypothetical protein
MLFRICIWPWNEKEGKGLPNRKMSANDRASTIDEIKKLVKYPDRAIQCNAM